MVLPDSGLDFGQWLEHIAALRCRVVEYRALKRSGVQERCRKFDTSSRDPVAHASKWGSLQRRTKDGLKILELN